MRAFCLDTRPLRAASRARSGSTAASRRGARRLRVGETAGAGHVECRNRGDRTNQPRALHRGRFAVQYNDDQNGQTRNAYGNF